MKKLGDARRNLNVHYPFALVVASVALFHDLIKHSGYIIFLVQPLKTSELAGKCLDIHDYSTMFTAINYSFAKPCFWIF